MLHQPVLLQESLIGLAIKPDGIYIDGTFGRGGHSQAIFEKLNTEGRLVIIDKDPEAICYAHSLFDQENRVTIKQGSFAHLNTYCDALDLNGKVNGILLDLGVSSPQIDTATRGFSFQAEGPLDMRMDLNQEFTAAHFINSASVEEMEAVFKELGEERFAKRIAKAIANARIQSPISSTLQLAEIAKAANPRWEKHKHPATRIFQALRLHINQELNELRLGLQQAIEVLAVGGRLAVISFHSLEDRIVKQFMRQEEEGENKPLPYHLPIPFKEKISKFRRIGKAIKPSEEEINRNYRARSAVLRIGEKLA